MVYDVIIQDRAERDIFEAFAYIEAIAPDAAVRWYRRIKASIGSLSEMPNRCVVAPESKKLGIEMRQLIVGKRSGRYRVVFRVIDERHEVHVLTVRHGARKPIEMDDIE